MIAEERRIRAEADSAPKPAVFFDEAVSLYAKQGGEVRFTIALLDHFTGRPLDSITLADLHVACEVLYPRWCKTRTIIRQIWTPMNAIYAVAAEEGLCAQIRFKRPKVHKRELPQIDYADDLWLAAARPVLSPRMWLYTVLMSYTGMRVGDLTGIFRETEGLFGRDVDLERRQVTIHNPKNGKTRVAPLPAVIVAAFRAIGPIKPDERVCHLSVSSGKQGITQALARAAKRAGIKVLSPHEVGRHAFAARHLAAGKSLKFVQEAGGWETIEIVAKTYGHLEKSQIDDAIYQSDAKLVDLLATGADKVVDLRARATDRLYRTKAAIRTKSAQISGAAA